jgi:integrase
MAEKRKDSKNRNLNKGESQRSDGRYMYRFMQNGRTKTIYALSLHELRQKEKEVNSNLDNGIDAIAANKLTLNDMFDKYISIKSGVKPVTIANYNYYYDKYVRDNLGKLKLNNIKYSNILNFYLKLLNEDKLSLGTLKIIQNIVHPVFKLAVKDGIILRNPSDGVLAEFKKSHGLSQKKRIALTYDEQSALMGFVKKSPTFNYWYNMFVVFLGTGMRCGELIGLTWKDIDFANGTISVNHSLAYKKINGEFRSRIDTPKTESGVRTIPMFQEVREALHKQRRQNFQNGFSSPTIDGYSDFVFLNRNGNVCQTSIINHALKRIIDSYNKQETKIAKEEDRKPLLVRQISCHNFRHTFATRLCESTSDIKVIQNVMGHSDIAMTMNIYAEATAAHKKETFAGIESKFKIS